MNAFKSAVGWAYKNPNPLVAIVLALLPVLFSSLLRVAFALPIDYIAIARALVAFIASAVVFYIILRVFKGNKLSGKFFGVFTALSLTSVVVLALIVVFAVFVLLIFPTFFPSMGEIVKKDLTAQQLYEQIDAIPIKADLLTLLVAGGAIIIISIIAILLVLYLFYQIIAMPAPSGRLNNIIILIVALFFLSLIQMLLP